MPEKPVIWSVIKITIRAGLGQREHCAPLQGRRNWLPLIAGQQDNLVSTKHLAGASTKIFCPLGKLFLHTMAWERSLPWAHKHLLEMAWKYHLVRWGQIRPCLSLVAKQTLLGCDDGYCQHILPLAHLKTSVGPLVEEKKLAWVQHR